MYKLDLACLDALQELLRNTDLYNLQILYIHGGSKMSLLKLHSLLPPLLQATSEQVFIDSFKLSPEDFQMVGIIIL